MQQVQVAVVLSAQLWLAEVAELHLTTTNQHGKP